MSSCAGVTLANFRIGDQDHVLLSQTQSPRYWTDRFQLESADVEHILSLFLETERPLTNRELALNLIELRLRQESDKLRRLIEQGQLFQPKVDYQIGQELIFPAYGFASGKVTDRRDGFNPDYGDFHVIKVQMSDAERNQFEFASGLTGPHQLNFDISDPHQIPDFHTQTPEAIYQQFSESITDAIEARLVDEPDAVYFGGRWFLQSLLAPVGIGDMHLAEAILDINNGGPVPTSQLVDEIELAKTAPQAIREFSLDVKMSGDERFDEVGPTGYIWWYLRRLEPVEVTKMPERLIYVPVPFDRSLLTPELLSLEADLDDEYSDLTPLANANEATMTLIYPHRRSGTLPLTSRIQALFPTANEAQRIRVSLVDGQNGNEFPGWVVRDKRYVVGLDTLYRSYKLPVGAYVTVRRGDNPTQLVVDFRAHKAHSEYIRLITPANNHLTFTNHKRAIAAEYDAFLIVGAEDLEGVDAVAGAMLRDKRRNLPELMRDLMIELAKISQQNAVHAKTLYSAVNVVRRCPPGPIFASLVARPEFEHVAGPYWRVTAGIN